MKLLKNIERFIKNKDSNAKNQSKFLFFLISCAVSILAKLLGINLSHRIRTYNPAILKRAT